MMVEGEDGRNCEKIQLLYMGEGGGTSILHVPDYLSHYFTGSLKIAEDQHKKDDLLTFKSHYFEIT